MLAVTTVPAPQLAAELTLCGNSPLSLYLFPFHRTKQKSLGGPIIGLQTDTLFATTEKRVSFSVC